MPLFAGIDAGSTTAKVVLIDDAGAVVARSIRPGGANLAAAAGAALRDALSAGGAERDDVAGIVATGYGRNAVAEADRTVTEITCHARGIFHLDPTVRGVIDIGGQDSKAIVLDPSGNVVRFEMNDKCAAGTGRFLEVMARTLEVPLEDMGRLALESRDPAVISSTCTVFAESEVVSLAAQGRAVEDILAGLCRAVAVRAAGLAGRARIQPPAVMTGGVARNAAVVAMVAEKLNIPLTVPPEPQFSGALGAALFARDTAVPQPPRVSRAQEISS
ncbi:MAG TPA: acyl-CoA dehydratase activase [Candidatus Hydrogenedentes bacterium]|nr:acyl-CoA dehydratase activase [Candidatus Hydrogenedentota bacterium]